MNKANWMAMAAAAFVSACGDGDEGGIPGGETAGNLAEVATERGFTALVAAADKAGLVPALSAPDANLTVFAPTDEAFTSLATTLGFSSATAMVEAVDADTLAKVLQYHVLPATRSASDLAGGGATQTTLYEFEGAPAPLGVDATSGVKLTDEVLTEAVVTTADVPANNGVIHAIDKVLVPPGVLDVVQMAQLNPDFSTLVAAVVQADLATTLREAGPFTVFAPTNDAFAAALAELGVAADELLASPDLADILTYHAVAGDVRAADVVALPKPADVTTIQGGTFTVGEDLGITDARGRTASLVAPDVVARNGVIHVIGSVLLPSP